MTRLPVSVVIPTIGRPDLLRETLLSIARCEPGPGEVIVVDQSDSGSAADVVSDAGLHEVRALRSQGIGRGLAVNEGVRAAANDIVMVVDDDCTVRDDWVEEGCEAMQNDPRGIVSGQVLPLGGDPRLVPSTLIQQEPIDFTGHPLRGVLYAGNMACSREALLEAGGFDQRIVPSAEDCDLAYRWLRDGGTLRHSPDLVVWHRDWRRPEQMERLYVDYYRGLGMFYAKHLRARDPFVIWFIARDLVLGLRAAVRGRVKRIPRWADPYRAVRDGLPGGLRAGWREFSS